MAKRRINTQEEEDLLGFINTSAVDDMLEGIEAEIPAYRGGDKIEFVHAGGKFKGSVLKALEEGKLKVADKAGTVFTITTEDVIRNGETASQLIARKKGEKRPVYVQTEEKEPKVVTRKALEKKATTKPQPKKTGGQKTQRELVEELAEKGERDYDVIAKKTGVTRVNVGQYMYRWKKANPKKA